MGDLWVGAWIASLAVGVFVWGLIGWVVVRYRARHTGGVPKQTRYNLPIELLYTLVPFLIIGVLFFFTVRAQDTVNRKVDQPDVTINVVGQKWSWTFNYMEADDARVGAVVHEAGTIERTPDLYLPVGKTVRFNLQSADVIHSFWIPNFYYKLDVIPGHPNSFDVTPTEKGEYLGKCAEFCGTYHSAMLFNVKVVDEAQYYAYLDGLKSKGQTGEITIPSKVTAIPVPSRSEEEHR
ncbi:cytochrome c oxidase subunit II [Propionicicella superfundia]|uniref:aa3-type cytochrome oxidase subunit II n=1 Tax=Propionicicella superfundia TaxID=348582 RepID=UPI0009FEB472